MRAITRLSLATGFMLMLMIAAVITATQNYLPKYNSAGSLVDSAVSEVGGNVGIGTATPTDPLTINTTGGDATARLSTGAYNTRLYYQNSFSEWFTGVATTGKYLIFDVAASASRLVIDTSGNVGLGTTTPSAKLHVNRVTTGLTANGSASVVLERNSSGNYIEFLGAATSNEHGLLWSDSEGNPGMLSYDFNLDRLNLQTSGTISLLGGNVGVGTASPTSKLHVAGDIKVDGNIAAKYQDIAEWVTTEEPVSPGTVVMITRGTRDVVRRSDVAYSTAVAGVVSPKPGITLGEPAPNKVLVAQSGRVVVKVDATSGAIEAGDLLVTSSTEGYAMRSEPLKLGDGSFHRPGTILGKALQPWTSGKGEILVLVTLQ